MSGTKLNKVRILLIHLRAKLTDFLLPNRVEQSFSADGSIRRRAIACSMRRIRWLARSKTPTADRGERLRPSPGYTVVIRGTYGTITMSPGLRGGFSSSPLITLL